MIFLRIYKMNSMYAFICWKFWTNYKTNIFQYLLFSRSVDEHSIKIHTHRNILLWRVKKKKIGPRTKWTIVWSCVYGFWFGIPAILALCLYTDCNQTYGISFVSYQCNSVCLQFFIYNTYNRWCISAAEHEYMNRVVNPLFPLTFHNLN